MKMKTPLVPFAVLFFLAVLSVAPAHAQCAQPSYICVTSFSISPNVILGDKTHTATGHVQAYIPSTYSGYWEMGMYGLSTIGVTWICEPPAFQSAYGCVTNTNSVTVLLYSPTLVTGSPRSGPVTAQNTDGTDPGISDTLTINPVPSPETPDQDPDLP